MSDLIERVEAARRFPTNTCGASRHAAQIGEALVRRWRYPMLTEEPAHCGESILATVAALWEARTEIKRLTAALQHEADCVEAAKAEIERLTDENRRLRADLLAGRNVVNAGLTIHTLTIERDMLRQEIERLTAERDELRRQLAEAQKEIHNLNWALGTEGYDQMATPEEQAEHEAAVRAHHDVLARLEEGKRAYEAMKRDARRYRWLRPRGLAADFAYGDPPVCAIVFRWPESAKISADFDRSIDAAMGAGNE